MRPDVVSSAPSLAGPIVPCLEKRPRTGDETDRGGTMKISGTHFRTIWVTESGTVQVIDQSRLPFEFATIDLETLADAARAIKTMVVRGAPLIGATAAYGMALAARADPSDSHLAEAATKPASDAPHGDQSGLGVDANAQGAGGSSAAGARRCGVSGSRRNL